MGTSSKGCVIHSGSQQSFLLPQAAGGCQMLPCVVITSIFFKFCFAWTWSCSSEAQSDPPWQAALPGRKCVLLISLPEDPWSLMSCDGSQPNHNCRLPPTTRFQTTPPGKLAVQGSVQFLHYLQVHTGASFLLSSSKRNPAGQLIVALFKVLNWIICY